jgi:hypothetical protein
VEDGDVATDSAYCQWYLAFLFTSAAELAVCDSQFLASRLRVVDCHLDGLFV